MDNPSQSQHASSPVRQHPDSLVAFGPLAEIKAEMAREPVDWVGERKCTTGPAPTMAQGLELDWWFWQWEIGGDGKTAGNRSRAMHMVVWGSVPDGKRNKSAVAGEITDWNDPLLMCASDVSFVALLVAALVSSTRPSKAHSTLFALMGYQP
ncbi:hypothetical protein CTheo_4893 [Ceratobasidium theobromae]|uniref:Uncharacterized protein n=1 Tax=Ceratobasidium theobromae TaxID=1582974 RepID=A0A5N5QIV8_9AGAM|nr:hypothetical protein CTheo_4893 [Ceratobasidium theobromae]